MKKRVFWLALMLVSLLLGVLLYGIYRQDTYIGKLFAGSLPDCDSAENWLSAFLSWYFPDFLWAFSLSCALFAIYLPKGKVAVMLSGISCAWGILWECLQRVHIVSGTADLWDVVLYIMAVISAFMINILKRGN